MSVISTSGSSSLLPFTPRTIEFQGHALTFRSITPDDRLREREFVHNLSETSRYSRFMETMRELPSELLDAFVLPDSALRGSIVALSPGADGRFVGVARFAACGEAGCCEFALTVADLWQGQGVGSQLLELIVQRARDAQFKRMVGYVLKSNRAMLRLTRRAGFVVGIESAGDALCTQNLDL